MFSQQKGFMEKVKSYRDLQVGQRSVDLAVQIYKITDGSPKSKQCLHQRVTASRQPSAASH
jgi:hypothetical protein